MISQIAIDALEACKDVLIDVLYKELKSTPGNRTEIFVPIMGKQDYYCGNYSTNTITAVSIDKEHDVVMVDYESFDEQFRDPIELFNIGEIADIIDAL